MATILPRNIRPSSICSSCRLRLSLTTRPLSSNASTQAPPNDGMDFVNATLRSAAQSRLKAQASRPAAVLNRSTQSPPTGGLSGLARLAETARFEAQNKPSTLANIDEPHHITVYTHKHNTHITFTDPNRNPILSLSAGDIGLKKSHRGSYDASYQLAVYSFAKMMEKQWRVGGKKTKTGTQTMRDVDKIEVLLRGYGPGREAFQKAILGSEGRLISHKVVRVTDGTRLKFGGCRSRQVRRL
jgi:small subunit ribosomal protein S11